MCLPLNNEGKDQGPAGTTAGKIHTEVCPVNQEVQSRNLLWCYATHTTCNLLIIIHLLFFRDFTLHVIVAV